MKLLRKNYSARTVKKIRIHKKWVCYNCSVV